MYNRYIPQADGSYRRSRVQEQSRQAPQRSQALPNQEPQAPSLPPVEAEKKTCPPQEQKALPRPQPPAQGPKKPVSSSIQPPQGRQHTASQQGGNVSGFLRQLLPKDFDTGDLLIVLLLLLMAGDCAEEQNTALLTLALYFFM